MIYSYVGGGKKMKEKDKNNLKLKFYNNPGIGIDFAILNLYTSFIVLSLAADAFTETVK